MAGRDAGLVAAVAAGAAVSVLLAGPSPTSTTWFDIVVVAAASAATVWAAASAPWWAGAATCGVAAVAAPSTPLTALALAGLALALWLGTRRHSLPVARAGVAALALTVLARLGTVAHFGLSSLLAIVAAAALAATGLARRSHRHRRLAYAVLAGAGGAALVALLGGGVSVALARGDLENGNRQARLGIAELGSGDIAGARVNFARAQAAFERADTDLGRPWALPARLVPVVAQHHRAGTHLTAGAVRATRAINAALAQVDLESLRMREGRLDIAAIEALQAPLQQLNAALDDLDTTVRRSRDPWLVQPLQRRLQVLADDIADQQVKGGNAMLAVREAPELLGATQPRRYFVAFTTPAEARGLGGFMGNYAELSVSGGRIELTGFGRHSDLNAAGDPSAKTLSGPADFLARWGRFGFSLPPGGRVAPDAWSDITLSPHFPYVADAIAQLYPQSGGRPVDGVFAMDVYTLARVLALTGPIRVEGLAEPLTADNAVRYLLYEQYEGSDNDARIDRLEDVARTAVQRLLSSELPPPSEIARLLGPQAAEGRLLAWAKRPEEQALFTAIGMDGALPPLNGGDGFTFALNNTVGNKIDAYLEGSLSYRVTPDRATGTVRSQAVLTLTSTAPATGLPNYVIGNVVGLPKGTNRTYLSFYSAFPHTGVTVDGQPASLESTTEAGWVASSMYLTWAPGQTRTIVVTFEGRADLSRGVHTVVRHPPIVEAFTADVEVLGEHPAVKRSTSAGEIDLLIKS